jgi:small subunit ribosomal protein S3Ae
VSILNKGVLIVFFSTRLTAGKLGFLLRNYQTLINAHVDARTPEGYGLRFFSVCFTKKINLMKACYPQKSSERAICGVRKDGIERMGEAQTVDGIRAGLNSEVMEKYISEQCNSIYSRGIDDCLKNERIQAAMFLEEPSIVL